MGWREATFMKIIPIGLCGEAKIVVFMSRKRRSRILEWAWHLLEEKGPLTTAQIQNYAFKQTTIADGRTSIRPYRTLQVNRNELSNCLRWSRMFTREAQRRGLKSENRLWSSNPLRPVAVEYLRTEKHALRRRDLLPSILIREIEEVENENQRE